MKTLGVIALVALVGAGAFLTGRTTRPVGVPPFTRSLPS